MKNPRLLVIGFGMLLAGAGLAPRLEAQELLQRVKDLYASAAYEAALSAVSPLNDADPMPDIEQYRILCLVALGRSEPAERSIERLLTHHPLYHPLSADTPPRIQELFTAVRRRLGRRSPRGCIATARPPTTISCTEFVEWLAAAVDLGREASQSKAAMLKALESVLAAGRDAGRHAALVVDEAQSLPDELLEEIRLLANIDRAEEKPSGLPEHARQSGDGRDAADPVLAAVAPRRRFRVF